MSGLALHRVVQEGLTNAAKHAPGAAVSVAVTGTVRTYGSGWRAVRAAPPLRAWPPGHRARRARRAGAARRGSLTRRGAGDGGFVLEAVLPWNPRRRCRRADLGAGAGPARREVRKDLARAIWIPLALLGALGLLMVGVAAWTQAQSYLEPEDYARLRIGQSLNEITEDAEDWPAHPLDGPPRRIPAEPSGMDECRYYRSTVLAAIPVYRLCFVDGHLADRAKVP
ncbi:hypothetical protein O1L60_26875 [Streptomyces diastatochromogenes]|nr:hypothetical protein [Streptomyces diastatochromogenes]